MVSASLSFEARLATKLKRWHMSLDSFSTLVALAGIKGASKAHVSRALNGKVTLPNTVTIALEPLLADIEAFMQAAAPLKLDTSSPAEFHIQMMALREGKLRISITHDNQ